MGAHRPRRAVAPARGAIETSTNTLLVSVATAWEIAITHRAGTWPEAEVQLGQHEDFTLITRDTVLSELKGPQVSW